MIIDKVLYMISRFRNTAKHESFVSKYQSIRVIWAGLATVCRCSRLLFICEHIWDKLLFFWLV